MDEVLQQVQEIFRTVLEMHDLELSGEKTAADIEQWDSLNNIRIVIAIEKHFDIRFTAKEIQSYRNVGEFCNAISGKKQDQPGV